MSKIKANLVGILYSNNFIEVVDLTEDINQDMKPGNSYAIQYMKTKMYLYDDVVYCPGTDREDIVFKLKMFDTDPVVKERYEM